ncbi:MFS transporter [Enemella evansiae]|uniref:MFS transporter n=1 Tax=Enemella evansiae TaxID=2016499 RepID=UPI0010EC92B5|nr:MFS transporter [Enemella evansiae]TDO91810.1 putative MFS family arabinose efflux permease [Enemella evansiae]
MSADQVQPAGRRSAWRGVVGFGLVSLAADMVYEGGRSIYGPLLATLGASAAITGLVTGAGEAMALVLRVVSGPLADRTGRYWALTLLGYGLTAICVPLLAITPLIGAAGLLLAILLILAERAGKAVRSPAKSALLAEAATRVGSGRGFGVHKALDQIGAFAGPLLVAALLAATGTLTPALAALVIPGAIAMGLLLWLRSRTPQPVRDDQPHGSWWQDTIGSNLGRRFWLFALAAASATAGLVTFGMIGFHLSSTGLLPLAAIPLAYAGGQLVAALAALVTGLGYDRVGGRVLYALPLLVLLVPVFAFTRSVWAVLLGIACWGAANGVQDSTIKAVVADLTPRGRRATAYGVFAAVQGAAAVLGGGLAGLLYERSIPALIAVVAGLQVITVVLLLITGRSSSTRPPTVTDTSPKRPGG